MYMLSMLSVENPTLLLDKQKKKKKKKSFPITKGQTTLSTKSRWRFRTKRRSKETFDHTRFVRCVFI